jgi:hypothetical protein
MSKFSRVVLIVGIIIAVVAIGVAVGWYGSAKPKPAADSQPTAAQDLQPSMSNVASRPAMAAADSNKKARIHHTGNTGTAASARSATATPKAATATTNSPNLIPDWEDKLDAILVNNDLEDPDKAKKMAEMFPNLSAEGQEEVAHHLSNLTPDENYGLGQYATNSALPEDVLDVFYEDVLNRPNGIKLPLLLQIAENPQHPNAQEAKDVLELFLDEDYGNDWSKWQSRMQQWLVDNPD